MDNGPITINQHNYRIGSMSAFEQLHVSRRIAPLIFSSGVDDDAPEGLKPEELARTFSNKIGLHLVSTFAKMTDEDVEYIIRKCLKYCQRENDKGGWSPVMTATGQLMFADISMPVMIELTIKTVMENLSDFFPIAPAVPAVGPVVASES
jgi:hypothetical protein